MDDVLELIEQAADDGNRDEASRLQKIVTAGTPENGLRVLSASVYKIARAALTDNRIDVAKVFCEWLNMLQPGQLATALGIAGVTQALTGSGAATQGFRKFVHKKPVNGVRASTSASATRVGILVSTGTADMDFDEGVLLLPDGHTEVNHLTGNEDFSFSLVFVDRVKKAHLQKFDILVCAISDSCIFADTLTYLQGLTSALPGIPVVNGPAKQARNTRDWLSTRFDGDSNLVFPKTVRLHVQLQPDIPLLTQVRDAGLELPVLVRPVSSQNGRGLEKLDTEQAATRYRVGDEALYVTEFVEFVSDDGFYRKYRCWKIGDRIASNHLFVHDQWKVHGNCRFTTMEKFAWAKDEEDEFLSETDGPRFDAIVALMDKLGQRTELDYFGADFAFSQDGRVIVFEANASMRPLHPEYGERYPYLKDMEKAHKAAFDDMLQARVRIPDA